MFLMGIIRNDNVLIAKVPEGGNVTIININLLYLKNKLNLVQLKTNILCEFSYYL